MTKRAYALRASPGFGSGSAAHGDLIRPAKSCFGRCMSKATELPSRSALTARLLAGAACLRPRCGGRPLAPQAQAPAAARRRRAARRVAALRQPESRPGPPAPGARHRVSGGLGVRARRPARRDDPASSRSGGRCAMRRHRRLGAQQPAERPPHGIGAAVGGQGRERSARSGTLRDDDSESARAIAQVEAGVLVSIIGCENGWCRISVGSFRGYIEQTKLWGTYPNETIKLRLRRRGRYFATSRTTTSMCEILRFSGGCGRPSTRMASPGMSISVPSRFEEVVVVVGRIGVEIGALAADRDLAQQPRPLELMQRVVDRRERHPLAGRTASSCRISAVTCRSPLRQQQRRQRHALACRPQPGPPKQLADVYVLSSGARHMLPKFAQDYATHVAVLHGNSSHSLPTALPNLSISGYQADARNAQPPGRSGLPMGRTRAFERAGGCDRNACGRCGAKCA